jgi:Flp pilus assembly protein TadD
MATKQASERDQQTAELLRGAARALRGGEAETAEAFARQALALSPRERGALYLHGLALLTLGRAAEAIAPLEGAAEGNPDPAVETNLATALAQAGKEEEALAWLERAVSRTPPFAQAFFRLGALLHMRTRLADAKGVLQRAVELAPELADAWAALAEVLTELGETRAARDAYTQALAARPRWPQARRGIARTLMDEGEFKAAVALLRRLLEETPADAHSLLDLAFSLQELGQFEAALTAYRQAAEVNPGAYKQALHSMVGAARGTFWLRPSALAKKLPRPS